MIWTVLDQKKRGSRGRRDEESEKMKNSLKKLKMKKSLKDASLASLGLVFYRTTFFGDKLECGSSFFDNFFSETT